jgi:serine/threonine protein kinase
MSNHVANEPLLPSFSTNDNTAQFEILSILGKGGQGTVYLTRSNKIPKDFALKIVKITKKKNLLYYLRSVIYMIYLSSIGRSCYYNIMCSYGIVMNSANFEQLSDNLKSLLKYSNMIYLSDSVPGNNIYLLYEFIDGTILTNLIDPDSLEVTIDLNLIKSIVHQLLKIIVYIHNLGFAHLDIKPDNLILEKNTNILKIIDVEFLCYANDTTCIATGISQHYSSPNLLNATYNSVRKDKHYTHNEYMLKADVFSTGLIIYDLLMRKPLMESIFKFERNSERKELVLDLPDHLNNWKPLIESMIRKDYNERISSTDALNEFERIFIKKQNNMDGGSRRIKRKHLTRKKYKNKQ